MTHRPIRGHVTPATTPPRLASGVEASPHPLYESRMGQEVLFYDGDCGLCDRAVRFVLVRDRSGRFRFAPIGGERYRAEILPRLAGDPPDALAVITDEGRLLWRSDAVIYLLRGVGGPWRAVAGVLRLIPRIARDWTYRQVARARRALFAAPTCPVATLEHRSRFDR